MNVSYFIPAYNCAETLEASVRSILEGNFAPGDELLVADDGSTDGTSELLGRLARTHPALRVLTHPRNLGGGAARNTCVRAARHSLLFCLDSDNLLAPGSVRALMAFMAAQGADVAAFGALHYFMDDPAHVSHASRFKPTAVTLQDVLGEPLVPGSSGNYLFTRDSWLAAGGYPETARALDAWGFGLRQVATGSRMLAMPDGHYFHRIGHASYYVREARRNDTSHLATRLLLPFLDLVEPEDVAYMLGETGRDFWFSQLEERPVRVLPEALDPRVLRARACTEEPDRLLTLLEERLVEPGSHAPLSFLAGRIWSAAGSYPCPDGVPCFVEPQAPRVAPAHPVGAWLAAVALPALPTVVQLGGASSGLDYPHAYRVVAAPEGPGSEREPPHPVVARPEALPFADDSVDAVVVPFTLEGTDNPLQTLLEIHRVLAEDGRLVLATDAVASPLEADRSVVVDAAFAEWYLAPLFSLEGKTPDGLATILRPVPGGRLWVTQGQLDELSRRIRTYRAARARPGMALPLYRELAVAETLLPSETPRRLYAMLQVAASEAPSACENLRAALGLVGGPLARELGAEPGARTWAELRPGLAVAGVADAGTVLGLLAQVAQASGDEALASDLADWSMAATV